MIKRLALATAVATVFCASGASAQEYPMLDRIAAKVIQKYQQSNCEQLYQQRNEPKPPMEQNAIQMLHSNPQMQQAFINQVAAPIANKLFQCGLIP